MQLDIESGCIKHLSSSVPLRNNEICSCVKGMLDLIISYKLSTNMSVTYYRIQQYPYNMFMKLTPGVCLFFRRRDGHQVREED